MDVFDEAKVIITTYSTASKWLWCIIEEYYKRNKRLYIFLIIDETHLLFNRISIIELTKEFDKISLLSALLVIINTLCALKIILL